MKTVLNYLKKTPEVAGVEIYLVGQGKLCVRYVLLRRKGNRVLRLKGEYHLQSLNDLKNVLGKNVPVVISLNGHGIIHRTVEADADMKKDEHIQQILPNTALGDFYIQEWKSNQNRAFISLARKEILDDLLELFDELNLQVLSVSLGPFAIQSLQSHSELPENGQFQIDGHHFTMNNGEMNNYQSMQPSISNSKKIKFAGEELNECLAIAYANALSFMVDLPRPYLGLEKLEAKREEHTQQRLFKKLAVGILGLFLSTLLLNSIFYHRYSSTLYSNQLEQVELLKKEEKNLQLILDNQAAISDKVIRPTENQYGSLSRIADLLAANVPASITLNDMSIFPSDKELSRKERRPVYDFTKVSLQGDCKTGSDLNRWLNDIRQLNFSKNVEIREYSSVDPSTSEFRIELLIE